MDAKEIEKRVARAKDDILKEVNDRLPRTVGVIAVNHFTQNFHQGGWLDNGLHPWPRTKRQDSASPDAKYSPLTSRRNHLMKSIQATTAPGQVTVENPVPYAAIHNDGGEVPVTQRMRRFAWAKVYSIAGIKKGQKQPKQLPAEAEMWKGLALTKKTTLRIPQRQFMGDSAELREKIGKAVRKSLDAIAAHIAKFRQ